MRNIFFSAVIFSGLVAIPASAVNFDFGADAVSRYVWRGGDAGDDSPAIQPAISATWLDGSLETGYWGSYSIASGATGPEIDSYITYHAGPISISLTDYFNPTGKELSNPDHHLYEISANTTLGKIDLLAGFLTGESIENSIWVEGTYDFGNFDGVGVSLGVGIGTENYVVSVDNKGKKEAIALSSTLNLSKGDYSASYVSNVDTDTSYLVFLKSF